MLECQKCQKPYYSKYKQQALVSSHPPSQSSHHKSNQVGEVWFPHCKCTLLFCHVFRNGLQKDSLPDLPRHWDEGDLDSPCESIPSVPGTHVCPCIYIIPNPALFYWGQVFLALELSHWSEAAGIPWAQSCLKTKMKKALSTLTCLLFSDTRSTDPSIRMFAYSLWSFFCWWRPSRRSCSPHTPHQIWFNGLVFSYLVFAYPDSVHIFLLGHLLLLSSPIHFLFHIWILSGTACSSVQASCHLCFISCSLR